MSFTSTTEVVVVYSTVGTLSCVCDRNTVRYSTVSAPCCNMVASCYDRIVYHRIVTIVVSCVTRHRVACEACMARESYRVERGIVWRVNRIVYNAASCGA